MPASSLATIDDLSQASGVDVDAIRTYERLGLLPTPLRFRRNKRIPYRQEHLDRLRFIQGALTAGLSLDDIGSLLGLHGGMRTCGDIYAIADRRLQDIRRRIDELKRQEAALEPLVASCPKQGGATACPILTTLSTSSRMPS